MRLQKLAYALFLVLMWGPQAAHGEVRITEDKGGVIGTYIAKYKMLRYFGETIVVDGMCASACTLVLGIIPHDKLCATPQAKFGFHQAFDFGRAASGGSIQIANAEATKLLNKYYPDSIKHWISQHHGLPPPNGMLWLIGKEVTHLVRPCGQKLPPIY